MTEDKIALREKINETRAKQRKYSCWEEYYAIRARRVINYQIALQRRIDCLERELEEMSKVSGMQLSDASWVAKKIMGGLQ